MIFTKSRGNLQNQFIFCMKNATNGKDPALQRGRKGEVVGMTKPTQDFIEKNPLIMNQKITFFDNEQP